MLINFFQPSFDVQGRFNVKCDGGFGRLHHWECKNGWLAEVKWQRGKPNLFTNVEQDKRCQHPEAPGLPRSVNFLNCCPLLQDCCPQLK